MKNTRSEMEGNYLCCFGEVLWDLLPRGKVIGGAPFNVAAHLRNLGVPAFFLSRVGPDEWGREIGQWLMKKKIPAHWIQTDPLHSTGTVKVTLDQQHQALYEIVFPVAWDFIEETDEMISLVESSCAFVFGSLACRHSVSRSTLFGLLEKAPLKVFDVNLRSPFYSKELIESLLVKADLVKMNADELAILAEWFKTGNERLEEQMTFLKKSFSLDTILVTKGGDGAVLLNNDGFFQSPGFKVRVADTVGSGDSFLAGFLKNHLAGKSIRESLTYAGALGALVAMHHGANPAIREEEIILLIQQQVKPG
jgi:fructokinase